MESTGAAEERKALGSVVQIDECRIQAHLDEVVRAKWKRNGTAEQDGRGIREPEAMSDQACW